ncbi:MAG: hypothetical protein JXA96_18265 [Sedimentisphaerales bacterium]|nr:hypothetical protein [Sedimentisphaerales bacterium]
MNPENKIKKLIEESKISTNTHTEKKILGDSLEHLEKLKQQKSPSYRLNIWEILIKNSFVKLTAAAVLIIVVLSGLHMIGGSSIAWADVVEKFQSVEFFSAVFYEKDDALADAEQFEIWIGQGGNARIRMGSQVIFGKDGQVTNAFDISNRSSVEADARAKRMLEMYETSQGRFSLNTVINFIAADNLTNVTPLVNSEAIISEDLVVFDSQLNRTQWMRIWALRESKLPIHIRIWGSRDGYCSDVFLTYSNKQPDEFFDPNAFEQVFRQQQDNNKANIAYAFLTDPGGKDITPKEVFKKSAYHIPVVKRAGITENGVVWIVAGKSRDYLPNGNPFHGFSRIEDDLGRIYISMRGAYRLGDDTSLDIFLPIDFPFDDKRPSKITLFREHDAYDFPVNTKPELIGTVDLTEWEENVPCPSSFGPEYTDTLSWEISLANKLKNEEQTERLERLLQEIPDWKSQPRNSSLLRFWIEMAADEMDFEKVIEIGEVLTPLLFENTRYVFRSAFREYITALAATNQLEQAKSLFKRIDAVDKLSDEDFYDNNLVLLIEPLIADANLADEQIADFLGSEYTKREGYESLLKRARQNAVNQRARRAARKRREEISEYYKSHPLPEKMELLERNSNEYMYFQNVPKTIPGHEGYKIYPIDGPISDLVIWLWNCSDIQPYTDVEIRFEEESAKQELIADLIYKEGISLRERVEFILNKFDMELILEEGPTRKVLVAHYNGQPLKDHRDVKAPLRYDSSKESKIGMTHSRVPNGHLLSYLFKELARQQDSGIESNDEKMVIVNETGLVEDIPMSFEDAFWPGAEGLELAKKWFEEQFGVTFTEETRAMKTYVIRKKEN